MMASPRPKRASGSAESSSIARVKASRAIFVRNFDERGKAEHEVHALEVRRQLDPRLGRFARALAITEHQPQLAEPRPGKRVLRLNCAVASSSVSRAPFRSKFACCA